MVPQLKLQPPEIDYLAELYKMSCKFMEDIGREAIRFHLNRGTYEELFKQAKGVATFTEVNFFDLPTVYKFNGMIVCVAAIPEDEARFSDNEHSYTYKFKPKTPLVPLRLYRLIEMGDGSE